MKEQLNSSETNQEPKIQTIILDMDGTLYQLDGIESGFKGSRLEKTIQDNVLSMVINREGFAQEEAQSLIDSLKSEHISFSSHFSERYGITRTDYFNQVWDIDPAKIVSNFEVAVAVVKELKQNNINLILLTQAPKIWQERVIRFLNLEDVFCQTYSADDFFSKSEMFESLAATIDPQTMLSAGDQYRTDIEPAQALGIKGLLITSPGDLRLLLELI